MSQYAILTLLVLILAIGISVVSLVRTRKVQARQIELGTESAKLAKLQREILEREEKNKTSANVSGYIGIANNGPRFYFLNVGPVAAHDVQLSIESTEGKESAVIESEYQSKFPVTLFPGHEVNLKAAFSLDTGVSFLANISWLNPDGTMGRNKCPVTFK